MYDRRLQFLRKFVLLTTLSAGVLPLGFCTGNENFLEFRETAGPGLQSGVKTLLGGDESSLETGLDAILNSIIDGIFVIIEPDSTSSN